MSVHYSLKKAFLQEFFKDISNKKGNFKRFEGENRPNHQNYFRRNECVLRKKEKREKSQAQR